MACSAYYSNIKIICVMLRLFLSSSFHKSCMITACSSFKDEGNIFYRKTQILANSSSSSGHSWVSAFSSGLLLFIAFLIITSDGFTYLLWQDYHKIYAEMSQDSVDRKLKEWNDTWFGNKIEINKAKYEIPDFLKR